MSCVLVHKWQILSCVAASVYCMLVFLLDLCESGGLVCFFIIFKSCCVSRKLLLLFCDVSAFIWFIVC